ncbi:uncharacterized protein PS065_005255 [Dugong dugon]
MPSGTLASPPLHWTNRVRDHTGDPVAQGGAWPAYMKVGAACHRLCPASPVSRARSGGNRSGPAGSALRQRGERLGAPRTSSVCGSAGVRLGRARQPTRLRFHTQRAAGPAAPEPGEPGKPGRPAWRVASRDGGAEGSPTAMIQAWTHRKLSRRSCATEQICVRDYQSPSNQIQSLMEERDSLHICFVK